MKRKTITFTLLFLCLTASLFDEGRGLGVKYILQKTSGEANDLIIDIAI